jgi:hypothetical protein
MNQAPKAQQARPETRADLECRVTLRLSYGPAHYHLLEIRNHGQNVCVQISSGCPRETVTQLAAFVAGLGAV